MTGWSTDTRWWHITAQESAEDEVSDLAGAFIRALQPEVVVETGTYTGQTAVRIGGALAVNGHGHLWTIEIDAGFFNRRYGRGQRQPMDRVGGFEHRLGYALGLPIEFETVDQRGARDVGFIAVVAV